MLLRPSGVRNGGGPDSQETSAGHVGIGPGACRVSPVGALMLAGAPAALGRSGQTFKVTSIECCTVGNWTV